MAFALLSAKRTSWPKQRKSSHLLASHAQTQTSSRTYMTSLHSGNHNSRFSSRRTNRRSRMCTQELIWCSCSHGELLPIKTCPRAQRTGACWTVVHGDQKVVVDSVCTYCVLGLNEVRQLGKPLGELREEARPEEMLREDIGKNWGMNDVSSTEFQAFDLGRELWTYE